MLSSYRALQLPRAVPSAASAPAPAAVLPLGERGTQPPSAAPCGTVAAPEVTVVSGTPATRSRVYGQQRSQV